MSGVVRFRRDDKHGFDGQFLEMQKRCSDFTCGTACTTNCAGFVPFGGQDWTTSATAANTKFTIFLVMKTYQQPGDVNPMGIINLAKVSDEEYGELCVCWGCRRGPILTCSSWKGHKARICTGRSALVVCTALLHLEELPVEAVLVGAPEAHHTCHRPRTVNFEPQAHSSDAAAPAELKCIAVLSLQREPIKSQARGRACRVGLTVAIDDALLVDGLVFRI